MGQETMAQELVRLRAELKDALEAVATLERVIARLHREVGTINNKGAEGAQEAR